MVAVGHLVGYGVGALDLGSIFGTAIGNTQFKQLCVIAALALLGAVGVTSWAVTERVLLSTGYAFFLYLSYAARFVLIQSSDADKEQTGMLDTLAQIIRTTKNLPSRIQAICWVQFWSWIGEYAQYKFPRSGQLTKSKAGSLSSSIARHG